jgi:hypothetical protein
MNLKKKGSSQIWLQERRIARWSAVVLSQAAATVCIAIFSEDTVTAVPALNRRSLSPDARL